MSFITASPILQQRHIGDFDSFLKLIPLYWKFFQKLTFNTLMARLYSNTPNGVTFQVITIEQTSSLFHQIIQPVVYNRKLACLECDVESISKINLEIDNLFVHPLSLNDMCIKKNFFVYILLLCGCPVTLRDHLCTEYCRCPPGHWYFLTI